MVAVHTANGHHPVSLLSTPALPDPLKLAAIYARVSTTEQSERGYSLPTQLQACLKRAQEDGYTVSHTFQEDYTGTSLNRPQLKQLRDLVRERMIEAIFIYDQDRLSRKLAHLLLLCEEFEQYQVHLCVVTMPAAEKSPENQLLSNVRGIIAEYERSKLLERTTRGLLGRAQAGNPAPNTVPLGYRYMKHGPDPCPACSSKQQKGGCYVIDEEEAVLVRRIFAMYVQGHYSMLAIAKRLTQERIPTQRDRRGKGPQRQYASGVWHAPMIQRILTNETYVGRMYYGKRENRPSPTNPDKRTSCGHRPREEWTLIPVPAILEEQTFVAAQDQAARNAQNSKRNRRYNYLFVNGRLRCGRCGHAMQWAFNKQRGYSFYRCNVHAYLTETPCRVKVNAAKVEAYVWNKLVAAMLEPDKIAASLEELKLKAGTEQNDLARDQRGFEAQISRCKKELEKWEAAYIDDVITLDDFKAKKGEIAMRCANAEQELAQLAERRRQIERLEVKRQELVNYFRRHYDLGKQYTLEDKRQTFEDLDLRATWDPDKQEAEITAVIPIEIASRMSWDARRVERSTGCRP